jgi:hypothetical protein
MNPFLSVVGRKVIPGGSLGSIFARDTFTGTNGTDLTLHTGEVGAIWAKVTGATGVFKITGNKVKGDSSGISLYYASGDPDTNEYDVEADVHAISTVDYPGVGGRINPLTDDGYYLHFALTNASWSLVARSGGTDTLLGSYTDTLTAGADRHIKLQIRNGSKKAIIDDVERISSPDNSITGVGRAGIRTQNSDWGFGSTGRTLDNFVATNA